MGLCSCSMSELNLRVLLGSLYDVVLVSEAVGKYKVTACICKLTGSLIGLLALRDVGL